jgi:hypothetical protein
MALKQVRHRRHNGRAKRGVTPPGQVSVFPMHKTVKVGNSK